MCTLSEQPSLTFPHRADGLVSFLLVSQKCEAALTLHLFSHIPMPQAAGLLGESISKFKEMITIPAVTIMIMIVVDPCSASYEPLIVLHCQLKLTE